MNVAWFRNFLSLNEMMTNNVKPNDEVLMALKFLKLQNEEKQESVLRGVIAARMQYVYKKGNSVMCHYLAVKNYQPRKVKARDKNTVYSYLMEKHQFFATKLVTNWIEKREGVFIEENLDEEKKKHQNSLRTFLDKI